MVTSRTINYTDGVQRFTYFLFNGNVGLTVAVIAAGAEIDLIDQRLSFTLILIRKILNPESKKCM